MKSLQEINKIAHIKNKKLYKIFFIVISSFLFIGIIIYNVFINTNELTHIEKVIKKHNGIKQSIANPKYPTIAKPVSSQSTLIYGDSVRVFKKIENK
jgi:hypothetical protein|tara:strand:- start:333 stop:623 length:291 start_codon:yes stop_codon:yes gene_type:complete